MKRVSCVDFAQTTINNVPYTIYFYYTGARGYAKIFNMQTLDSKTAFAGGFGYDKRGAAASKAFKKFGIEKDENFTDKLRWYSIL